MRLSKPRPYPFRSRAFTLVELLVVIAVVVILGAILVPVVGAARASAHASRCSSNLRSIGVAGMLFSQDHQGRFSSSRLYNSMSDAEPGLKEYFDNNSKHPVFTCPSLGDYEGLGSVHTYTLALVATDNTKPGPRALIYRNRVEFPELTAWVMDGAWLESGPWFSSYIIPYDTDLARLVYPHKGQQNVLFVDGHVEAVGPGRLADRYNVIWSGLKPKS
jgi:prepilin-type N-terminal cleavage/methylation domain-containing protein/prepilin-type processing-associated H-X9-DG protein